MEFIKQMKKREFIEMSLKALAAIMAAFLAIILMESMIYGIKLNAFETKGSTSISNSGTTIAYCIEKGEDKYFVLYYDGDKEPDQQWTATKNTYKTKAECEKLVAKEIIYGAPSAFKFTITPVHYVVMSIFVAAVAGFFVYKFVALSKTYKKIEYNFNENGTIEF